MTCKFLSLDPLLSELTLVLFLLAPHMLQLNHMMLSLSSQLIFKSSHGLSQFFILPPNLLVLPPHLPLQSVYLFSFLAQLLVEVVVFSLSFLSSCDTRSCDSPLEVGCSISAKDRKSISQVKYLFLYRSPSPRNILGFICKAQEPVEQAMELETRHGLQSESSDDKLKSLLQIDQSDCRN